LTATISVGSNEPNGVAVSPNGSKVYVANYSGNVSVIDAATNTVSTTIPVGANPNGVAVSPDGSKVYVTNVDSNNVSVIDAATNAVSTTILVGSGPIAYGLFIQPRPTFAGTLGTPNCHGQSVSVLNQQYGNINAAAKVLSYSSVQALQDAIRAYCGS
jgi:YVTN family beta-propeller protein